MLEINNYQDIIQSVLFSNLEKQLERVKDGHCMKLTGLPNKILIDICLKLKNKYKNIGCWLLSSNPSNDFEISATKLVELRNNQDKPLLILIPSNLRTAAEDSFGEATFKEIILEGLEKESLGKLEHNIPSNVLPIYKSIISHLVLIKNSVSESMKIKYLIEVRKEDYSKESFGKYLYIFNLIPDNSIADKRELIEQRIGFNNKSLDILNDVKIPLIQRIDLLNIESNTIQTDLYRFLSKIRRIENILSWGGKIAKNSKYFNLNLSKWKFKALREATQFEEEYTLCQEVM